MKKTICLVTDWYPTNDNPYKGLFFKEQAFAVKDNFDFVIFRYREHFKKNLWKRYNISVVNEEVNTKEYLVDVYVPVSVYLADLINNLKVKYIKKSIIDGVGKYASKKRIKFTKKNLIKIFDKHITENIDVFYCIDAQTEAFRLQCLAEYYNKPYVVGEHAPVPWPGNTIQDVNKFAIEKADLFLAISNDKIRQLLLQNIKLPKIIYIGNLIDETKLLIKDKKKNEEKVLIIIAANSYYKNYDMFFAVMNRLTEITNQLFKIMIVGYAANKGYSKDKEGFELKVYRSKFSDKVELIPEVPHDQICEVLTKSDAFVMTSIQEGQPVSAMEAACCGLPVFSTRCGGVEDYVDEKMGRIYSVTDVEGMANGLKDYLEGKIKFDSEYIRERVILRFGKKAFINNYANAINNAIEKY